MVRLFYALVLLVTVSFQFSGCKGTKKGEMPLLSIPVATVVDYKQPSKLSFVGQVYGESDVELQARVNGYLLKMNFEQGSMVQKGQILYEIESDIYQAKLQSAKSLFYQAQADLIQAESNYNRTAPLAKIEALSMSELDNAVAQLDNAKAQLENTKAQVRFAEVELSYTRIISPVTGIIGETKAKLGAYVGPATNIPILNTVSNVSSVEVRFALPSTTYLELVGKNGDDEFFSDIELQLSNGEIYPYKGEFDFLGRDINPSTSSMIVQASFPNPDNILRPGQYAKIMANVGFVIDAMLVPQKSITQMQNKYSIYVVDDKNIVQFRIITVGEKVAKNWVVTSGLKAGDIVVVEGLQKMRPGMEIKPVTTKELEEEQELEQKKQMEQAKSQKLTKK